jgi:cerevisin
MKLLLLIIFYWIFLSTNVAANERYIVVLKPNITSEMVESHLSDIRLHALVSNNRTSRIGNFHFYSAHLSETGIQQLETNHSHVVDYFVKDQTFRIQELVQQNPPNWGLTRIDTHSGTDSLFSFPTSAGSGVDIYVLDTGVYAQHSDLVSRVTSAPSVIGSANDTSDSNAHGTFVAGVCCGKSSIKGQT